MFNVLCLLLPTRATNPTVRTKEKVYGRKPRASKSFLICVGEVGVGGEAVGEKGMNPSPQNNINSHIDS